MFLLFGVNGLFDRIREFKSDISIRAVNKNSLPQITSLLITEFVLVVVEEGRGSNEAPKAGM